MNRIGVQNALKTLARSGSFCPVTYDADGTATAAETPLPPDAFGVTCNESSSAFDTDNRNGKSLTRIRSLWLFDLEISFQQEVLLETFEDSLCRTPPVLLDEQGKQVGRLNLIRTKVNHPPRQGAMNGTQAVFTFAIASART